MTAMDRRPSPGSRVRGMPASFLVNPEAINRDGPSIAVDDGTRQRRALPQCWVRPIEGVSPRLTASAYNSPGGEYTWKRADAARAARALGRAGYGLLGGELWVILPDGRVYGHLPGRRPDRTMGWCGWETDCSREPAPSNWPAFCRRTAEDAAARIEHFNLIAERDGRPDAVPYLCYNLSFVTRERAAALGLRV